MLMEISVHSLYVMSICLYMLCIYLLFQTGWMSGKKDLCEIADDIVVYSKWPTYDINILSQF